MQFLSTRLARKALGFDIDLAVSTERGLGESGYQIDRYAPIARSVAAFRQMLVANLAAFGRASGQFKAT